MTDVTLPPPPPKRPPPPPPDDLGAALTGLETALHLAAVELRLTTEGVRCLSDPALQVVLARVRDGVNVHLGLAAHGAYRLRQLLTAPAEDERST